MIFLSNFFSLDVCLQSMAAQYSVQELREIIAATIIIVDYAKFYLLLEDEHKEVSDQNDWLDNMKKDGTWCDEIFIHLADNFLKKEIILLPIYARDGHGTSGKIIISPLEKIGNPFYFLYYKNIHFQSIIPTNTSALAYT